MASNSQMEEHAVMVAAIDFGTTFSGYAFSFRHEYENDPLKVNSSQWMGSSRGTMSLKTSSCILLDRNRKFAAFGFEAEDKYSDLAMDDEHREWYYFRRFKMMLYDTKNVHRNTELVDETGKKMPAIDVFSSSIAYLKDHLLMSVGRRARGLDTNDIRWVLTVPAIWGDVAKQFMREAAERAGIPGDRLLLALEPEAASLFCKYLPVELMQGTSKTDVTCFRPNSRYLVLDAGGGTMDITVHEVQSKNAMRELFKANGGPWGGTTVDKAFISFLTRITGQTVMDKFAEDFKDDYMDLHREFEVKKRIVKPEMDSKITIKIPISLHEIYREIEGAEIREGIRNLPDVHGKMTFAGDKLRVNPEVFKSFFEETLNQTISHLKLIFDEPAVKGTDTILLVGGFSESPMLCDAVRSVFPDKRVVIPQEPGLAVLKGAVIFGHNTHVITARIAKYTYGIKSFNDYREGYHPASRKFIDEEGQAKVRGTFVKLVEVGDSVRQGDHYEGGTFFPYHEGDCCFAIKLYQSPDKVPMFVDDPGCVSVGNVGVDCGRHGATVSLAFGGTELEVRAVDIRSGRLTKATFDFLD